MRGKTKEEAEKELKKEGISEDRLKLILPHKVREIPKCQNMTFFCCTSLDIGTEPIIHEL